MKKFLNLVLFLVVVVRVAHSTVSTTLEYALEGEYYDKENNTYKKVDVQELNKTLKSLGLDGLPEKIRVGKNPKPYWDLLDKRIGAANKALSKEMDFNIQDGYIHHFNSTCYRGEASEIPNILKGLVGNFLLEDEGPLAIRYGKKQKIYSDVFKSEKALKETYKFGSAPGAVKQWLTYKTNSDVVLVMSDLGPQGDGTELFATDIKKCEK